MAAVRLVTRGDDAGSCTSADSALAECARGRILKNIGVMVPGPTFDSAAALLRDLEGVAIGLHVTLNAEWDSVKWGPVLPAEKVPSLVQPDSSFTPFPKVLHERGFSKEEAMAEVRAQLAKARSAGLEISYLDEHMGVGWIGLREELARLCEEEGLVDHAKVRYLEGAASAEELILKLQRTEPGTYAVVTHPGRDADDMRAFVHPGLQAGQIAREREGDRRLWLDPKLRQAVEQGLFEPIRYDAV
jgi:predicted glycoside hydrolase/deacetylase ChbG (UPF0249 family)